MTDQSPHTHDAAQLPQADITASHLFPPLETITRPTVETTAAAFYLNRRPQTLRVWACFENGPIRPLRVNGRLAWRVTDIKTLMGVVE